MQQDIRAFVASFYPAVSEMPYCTALLDGRFDKPTTLLAEVVELYRAFNTREVNRGIYLAKLRAAVAAGELSARGFDDLLVVIEDEGQTAEHADHLDIRLQLFAGVGITRTTRLKHNSDLESINRAWSSVFEDFSFAALIAVNAAVEDWYTKIAALLEQQYLTRGYTAHEVATYTLHKGVDVEHSTMGFDVLGTLAAPLDFSETEAAVRRTFDTSRGYDRMKLVYTDASHLDSLVARDKAPH